MNELERLKKIVEGEGFDKESRDYVLNLEQRLQDAIAAEKLALHPIIKAYLEYLRKEIVDCKQMLSEDQSLGEVARARLFERINQCKKTLQVFGEDKADIEAQVKSLFEQAQNLPK